MSLHHRLRGSGSPVPSVVTSAYVGGTNITSSGTTFTFTNHAIGTADANRKVVVVAYPNGSSVTDISGVTIGGNAANQDVKLTSISNGPIGIYSLAVASGTTATIVVSTTGTAARCRIEVYTVTGNLAVPTILDTGTGYHASFTSVSDTLTTAPGTAIIAGMGINGSSGGTLSWTGVTKDNEDSTGSALRDMSVGHADVPVATSTTVIATSSSSTTIGMVAAVYQ